MNRGLTGQQIRDKSIDGDDLKNNITINSTGSSDGGFYVRGKDGYLLSASAGTGIISMSGSVVFSGSLVGSITHLPNGEPYLVAGPNITINTSSTGQLSITGSSGGGSFENLVATKISGSLTKLSDGSDYIRGSRDIQVVTGSKGYVKFDLMPSGLDTYVQFNDGDSLGSDYYFTYDRSTKVLTVGGTVYAPALTGSLTRLTNGAPYIVAGPNITINTSSVGQIVITGSVGSAGVSTQQQLVASYTDNFTTSWMSAGVFEITWTSPATYTNWNYSTVLAAPPGFSVQARLYDVTNSTAVASSIVSTTSTTPAKVTSSPLTIPVINSTRLYMVQISIVTGSPTSGDRGIIYSALNNLS